MPRTIQTLLLAVTLALAAPAVAQELGETATATQVSTKDKIQGAKDALTEMVAAEVQVGKDLEAAEKNGDAEAAECIRQRRSKISALVAVSARAQDDMNAALATAQEARADHEFRKIQVALTRVRQFRSEALTCMGEGAVADGATEVTVESDLDDRDDTQGLGISDGVVGTDPPGTTPFEN